MGEKLEALWIVAKRRAWDDGDVSPYASRSWLFRTRAAARKYANDQQDRSKRYYYTVDRATWGPEQ